MADYHKGPGFFAGLVLGGIVGAAVGFLLSPQFGPGGREALRAKLNDLVAQGKETIREAIEEGREAAARKEGEPGSSWDQQAD